MNLQRCGWPALACLMLSNVHAAETSGYSATMSVQGDENDNRQWLGKIVLPLGDRAWLQGSLGEAELAPAGASDVQIVGAAFGIAGQTADAAVEFVQRNADGRFEQNDWAAALTWRGARGGVGADAFLRSTSSLRESADGTGFGLHGDFAVTPQARLFAGAMRYRYDFSAEPLATQSTDPLTSLLGTNVVPSGTWRDQAFIERSYRVGGSYRLHSAALSAQYFRDSLVSADDVVNTVQLQAEFLVAGHWLISPMIGHSAGGSLGRAGYGGLSLSFNW
jgi:hypothetical protein